MAHGFVQPEVNQPIPQMATHQKLGGQIINNFGFLFRVSFGRVNTLLEQLIPDAIGQSHIVVVGRCELLILTLNAPQIRE